MFDGLPVKADLVAAPLEIEIASTMAAIDALAEIWRDLETRSSGVNLFQSYAWIDHVARFFDSIGPFENIRANIVIVRKAGLCQAIVPLRVMRQSGLNMAVDFSDPYGQYGGALMADGADANAILNAVSSKLKQLPAIDGMLFRRVRADTPLFAALDGVCVRSSVPDQAPSVNLAVHDDFAGYHASINSKTRKNLRNARNKLARMGDLEHRTYGQSELKSLVAKSFDGRLKWLEENALTSSAFQDPHFKDFVLHTANTKRGDLPVMAMALTLDDAWVSLQWGFVHKNRYYAFIAARNPEYDKLGPGKLHLEDVVRTCKENGIATCDFLAPGARYKFTWADQATEVVDFAMPFNWRSHLILEIWKGRLRPMLKWAYLKLPVDIRRRLLSLFDLLPSSQKQG